MHPRFHTILLATVANARSLPSRRRASVAATESLVVADQLSPCDRTEKSAIGNISGVSRFEVD